MTTRLLMQVFHFVKPVSPACQSSFDTDVGLALGAINGDFTAFTK